jgi:hypothetical protein
MTRIFLLSPAKCSGQRARWIMNKQSTSELAQRLRSAEGVPLGEVFSFVSALYFRGKLAYARAFAQPPSGRAGVWIITPTAGLLTPEATLPLTRLRGFARSPISKRNALYRRSLRRDLSKLTEQLEPDSEIILLGSIASGRYLDILSEALGPRLKVPLDFMGMGDMQRGAMLLRCVRENRELNYIAAPEIAERRLRK